jgi:short-subunit dehydrogenase involved in D-alanine esterification of teichoic acids
MTPASWTFHITGGSSGLGRAFATAAPEAGNRVVCGASALPVRDALDRLPVRADDRTGYVRTAWDAHKIAGV